MWLRINRKGQGVENTTKDKTKLLLRARRIRGQVEVIERAFTCEQEFENVLNLVAACRGAFSSLMVEMWGDHFRSVSMFCNGEKRSLQTRAVREFIDVIRPYLKQEGFSAKTTSDVSLTWGSWTP